MFYLLSKFKIFFLLSINISDFETLDSDHSIEKKHSYYVIASFVIDFKLRDNLKNQFSLYGFQKEDLLK